MHKFCEVCGELLEQCECDLPDRMAARMRQQRIRDERQARANANRRAFLRAFGRHQPKKERRVKTNG